MLEDLEFHARWLAECMSHLSEDYYCAGWLHDLEYELWEVVIDDPEPCGGFRLAEHEVARLKQLSKEAGGWIVYEDIVGETFIPFDAWALRFNTWKQKQRRVRAERDNSTDPVASFFEQLKIQREERRAARELLMCDFRELIERDWSRAHEIIRQLRTELDRATFDARVKQQRDCGYVLIGAWEKDALLGVMGMRTVITLARGAHCHIDELVVDGAHRRRGVGSALMSYAEQWARQRQLSVIFLDSRPDAIGFYISHDFGPHTATLMRKHLS